MVQWLRPDSHALGFPGSSVLKNLPVNAGDAGDVGLIPGLRRSPGEGNGNPLQYSCLENPMDRGAWWAIGHGVAKSQTTEQLSMHLFSLPRAWVQSLVRELIIHKQQHGQYINNKNTIYVIWMTKIYISRIYLIFTHSFWFTTFQNSWNFLRDKNNGIILGFWSSNPENPSGKVTFGSHPRVGADCRRTFSPTPQTSREERMAGG